MTGLPDELELTDGVVTLRRWTTADVDALTEIWQDGELQQRFGVEPPVTTASIGAYVAGVDARWRDGCQISLAVVIDGEIVGGCDLDDLDTDEPDLGYWTAAAHRRRGLATRVAAVLLDWAVAHLDAGAIRLIVEADNVASIAIAQRLGFRRLADLEVVEDDRVLDVYERRLDDGA